MRVVKMSTETVFPQTLNKFCLSVGLQEQYQFLYNAMLSLIGTQEDKKTLQSPDNNGTIVVGTASAAESLESLV